MKSANILKSYFLSCLERTFNIAGKIFIHRKHFILRHPFIFCNVFGQWRVALVWCAGKISQLGRCLHDLLFRHKFGWYIPGGECAKARKKHRFMFVQKVTDIFSYAHKGFVMMVLSLVVRTLIWNTKL